MNDIDFTALLHETAHREAPRVFALVEEYERQEVRVAGYGLAYGDRAESNSVEGDFRLLSDCPDNARALYEASGRGVRRVHLVWLATRTPDEHP
ncbi:hypothetical protein AB0425_22440 [Actinosynnema sp. NPDC051121]